MIIEDWRSRSCCLVLVLHQDFDIICDLSSLSFVTFGSAPVHISLLTALHTCLQTSIICKCQQIHCLCLLWIYADWRTAKLRLQMNSRLTQSAWTTLGKAGWPYLAINTWMTVHQRKFERRLVSLLEGIWLCMLPCKLDLSPCLQSLARAQWEYHDRLKRST